MNNSISNANKDTLLKLSIMNEKAILRYLKDHPQFASDILDLSQGMTLDESLTTAAWKSLIAAACARLKETNNET